MAIQERGVTGIINLGRDVRLEVNIPGGIKSVFYRFVKPNKTGKWEEVPIQFSKTYNDGSKLDPDDSGAFFHAVDKDGNECDWMYFISDVGKGNVADGEEELYKYTAE